MGKRKSADGARPTARIARSERPVIVGERVRALREKRGWSQPDLSYRANLHPADISQVERERRNIRTPNFLRLVIALGTSADYLLGLTDDPKPAK